MTEADKKRIEAKTDELKYFFCKTLADIEGLKKELSKSSENDQIFKTCLFGFIRFLNAEYKRDTSHATKHEKKLDELFNGMITDIVHAYRDSTFDKDKLKIFNSNYNAFISTMNEFNNQISNLSSVDDETKH